MFNVYEDVVLLLPWCRWQPVSARFFFFECLLSKMIHNEIFCAYMRLRNVNIMPPVVHIVVGFVFFFSFYFFLFFCSSSFFFVLFSLSSHFSPPFSPPIFYSFSLPIFYSFSLSLSHFLCLSLTDLFRLIHNVQFRIHPLPSKYQNN